MQHVKSPNAPANPTAPAAKEAAERSGWSDVETDGGYACKRREVGGQLGWKPSNCPAGRVSQTLPSRWQSGRVITRHAPRRRKVGSKEAGDLETPAGPRELYAAWTGCRGCRGCHGCYVRCAMCDVRCRGWCAAIPDLCWHLGVVAAVVRNNLECLGDRARQSSMGKGESKCQQKPLRPCAAACTWVRDRGAKLTLNLHLAAHSPSFLNTSTSTIIEGTCGAVPP